MKHGRQDYQRIQDPAANQELLDAYRAARNVHAGLGQDSLEASYQNATYALGLLLDVLRPTLEPIVDGALPLNPIRVDEPVFLLRATDKLAPHIVREYARVVRQTSPNPDTMWRQSDLITDVAIAMEEWQHRYGFKLPDLPPRIETPATEPQS